MKKMKACDSVAICGVLLMMFMGAMIAGSFDTGIDSIPTWAYIIFGFAVLLSVAAMEYKRLLERRKEKNDEIKARKERRLREAGLYKNS